MPWFEDDSVSSMSDVDAVTRSELKRAVETKELSGRLYEIFIAAAGDAAWKTKRVRPRLGAMTTNSIA